MKIYTIDDCKIKLQNGRLEITIPAGMNARMFDRWKVRNSLQLKDLKKAAKDPDHSPMIQPDPDPQPDKLDKTSASHLDVFAAYFNRRSSHPNADEFRMILFAIWRVYGNYREFLRQGMPDHPKVYNSRHPKDLELGQVGLCSFFMMKKCIELDDQIVELARNGGQKWI